MSLFVYSQLNKTDLKELPEELLVREFKSEIKG